jgi:anaphase-promoting complex subunit 7
MKFLAFTAVALLTDYLALSFQEPSAILQTPQYASKKSLGRCFMSVPNAIDTLTSGLASIVRVDDKGLAGVTIVDNLNSNDDIRLLKLFDVENSNDCRLVRETVTELDLVVEKMIPAAPKSRALIDSSYPDGLPQGQEVPCLVASLTSGDEIVISGASALVKFLKGTFSNESIAVSSGEEKEPLQKVIQAITPLSLLVTSLLRVGRGSNLSPAANEAKRPELPLIMYSYEGNQFCRLVREVLTELDIVRIMNVRAFYILLIENFLPFPAPKSLGV